MLLPICDAYRADKSVLSEENVQLAPLLQIPLQSTRGVKKPRSVEEGL